MCSSLSVSDFWDFHRAKIPDAYQSGAETSGFFSKEGETVELCAPQGIIPVLTSVPAVWRIFWELF